MTNPYAEHVPVTGSGKYLKLDDGGSAKIRIASEPYIFNNVFENKKTGETSITTRYAWLVFNKTEEKAQVLQLPATAYKAIAALATNEEWGDPTGYDITLKREGSGTDTKWHVQPSPNKDPLTEEQKTKVGELDMKEAVENAVPLAQVTSVEELPLPSKDKGSEPTTAADDGRMDALAESGLDI